MKCQVTKINAAVEQLDWAIKLFLDSKAYVPAITLAGAAEEIIGEAVSAEAAFHILKKRLAEKTGLEEKIISQNYLNRTKNWLKHWKDLKDEELLSIDLETEAIHYITRAITNLFSFDDSLTSESSRFFIWINENKKELICDL